MEISVTVNGVSHTSDVEPRTLLVHYVREHLGLPGLRVRLFLGDQTPDRKPPLREVPLVLDTAWIDADAERLVLVWRGRAKIRGPKMPDVQTLFAFTEPMAQPPATQAQAEAMLASTESQLAATVDYVGAEHFLYASDISHWDNEFPENLIDLRNHRDLSDHAKKKFFMKTPRSCSLCKDQRRYSWDDSLG